MKGGESTFLDAFAAADDFRQHRPDMFEVRVIIVFSLFYVSFRFLDDVIVRRGGGGRGAQFFFFLIFRHFQLRKNRVFHSFWGSHCVTLPVTTGVCVCLLSFVVLYTTDIVT